MEVVGLAGLIAIIAKLVDFAKYVTNRDRNAAVTQLTVWAAALAVALLAREAEQFATVAILGTTFGRLDLAAVILFALGLGSTASGLVDFRKAIDGHTSAATPPLLPGTHTTPTDAAPGPTTTGSGGVR